MTVQKLKSICENITENEPMKKHTTFRVGGCADFFAEVSSADEIKRLIEICRADGFPYMIIGNGSNLLVGDKGIRGLVIHIGKNMSECVTDGETVTAQAGILMSSLASKIAKSELSGFEELSGIPGTLGGGIFMNAGAYGTEIKDVLESVTYLCKSGEIVTKPASELDFGYRTSMFQKGDYVILSCVMRFKKSASDKIKAKTDEYKRRRTEKQPLTFPSAGSTFKRPEGYFAGKLIEDSGLKGFTFGGAQVSELHSGFVINTNGANGTPPATAADILAVIDHVKKTVYEKFGVMLETEVRFVGEK